MSGSPGFKEPSQVCPACAGRLVRPWLRKCEEGIDYHLWRCAACGSGFMNPQPRREFLTDYYRRSGQRLPRPVTLAEVLAGEAEYPENAAVRAEMVGYARTLLAGGADLTALDIGSGYGFFSQAARAAGFRTTAVNPGDWENEIFAQLNGFRPVVGYFEEFETEEKYDLIILSHVLEHVEDPAGTLTRIRTLLKEQGVLAIAVPNVESIIVKVQGKHNKSCLVVPDHLTYFSQDGLFSLLQRRGFMVRRHRTLSSIPYASVSDRLKLQGDHRKLVNNLVRLVQLLPLRLVDLLGLGFSHLLWAQPAGG